jgi:type I restriction enzyme S subunit
MNKKWIESFIGDGKFTQLIMGQSPAGDTYNKENIGLPFYQGKADFGEIYPTPTVWCDKPKKIALPNDILLCVRAPVGPTNIAGEKCCIGRGLAAIRCLDGLDFRYMYLVLKQFEKELADKGRGSTFDAIGKEDIKKIHFTFPSDVEDQIQIAEKINSQLQRVEKMRKTTLRQLDSIENLPVAILREAFSIKINEN